MRRAPIVIAGTIAGVAAVLSFKPREPATPTASAAVSAPAPTTTTPSTTTTPATGSTSKSSSAAKTVDGNAIATRYGNAQVRVTVAGGKITKIVALQLQGNEPKSVQISGQAAPILQQEALTKQSAAIDVVSGATITSASYEASLQSALDKLGFKAADGSRGTSTVPDVPEHDGDRGGQDGGDGGVPPGFSTSAG